MIQSFANRRTASVFASEPDRGVPSNVGRRARTKLLAIDAAESLDDLRLLPGNRLEALKGDRRGQHSIRVNDQWRICFQWRDGHAWEVELADYHR